MQLRLPRDPHHFDPRNLREILNVLKPQRLAEARMVRPARIDPRRRRHPQTRLRQPHHPGHRQLRQRLIRLHHVNLIDNHPKPVAHIHQRRHNRRPARRRKHQPHRIRLPANPQRMHLQRRLPRRNRRANLQHVRAQNFGRPVEVVRVVLHKRRPARQTLRHHLHRPHQRRRLPVALAAKPVPLRHQPLRRNPRQLLQPPQILKRVRERPKTTFLQKRPQPQLNLGRHPQRVRPVMLLRNRVLLAIHPHQLLRLGIRKLVHPRHQVPNAIPVHAVAQHRLRRHLVAVRHRYLAHVVAKPRHLQVLRLIPGRRRPRPRRNLLHRLRVLPEPHHNLAIQPQPARNMPKLAIPMRRLVQVHKIHVNRRPRQRPIELRVQMQKGLRQRLQPRNPHLCRRERVHPQDQPRTLFRHIRVSTEPADLIRRRQHRFEHDCCRDARLCAQRGRNRLRVLRHPLQRSRPIQVLAPRAKPNFQRLQIRHGYPRLDVV